MSEPSLPDKIETVHAALDEAGIEHAFGGALALAYYAEPRATDDIDVNIFLPPERFDKLAKTLRPLGVQVSIDDAAIAARDGQCRLWWGRTPVDVFLASESIHEEMRRERRSVPFGDRRVPILSPEHLLFCKVLFDRPKDWLDAEQMLVVVDEFDTPSVLVEIERAIGASDARTMRLRALIEPDESRN